MSAKNLIERDISLEANWEILKLDTGTRCLISFTQDNNAAATLQNQMWVVLAMSCLYIMTC